MALQSTLQVPHLKFPLAIAADGSFDGVEQDSLDDVRQCVYLIARTPLGSRPASPGSGVNDPTFTTVNGDLLEATIEDQEPRALVDVTVVDDGNGNTTVNIAVALASEAG